VAWKIKQLKKNHKGIFHEFQFGKPKSTCISAIILKTLAIDSINVTDTPAVIDNIDETKSFDLVINGIALLSLRSIGFQESYTNMIDKTWSGIKCHVKTAKPLYGMCQGSTPTTDLWGMIQGLVMNALAFSFIGILIISVSKQRQYERIGE
jgi:hypothetical protein